uniref:Uncharacterized protein n=1 Tax=viral metagenome TaxID=1070528 RepID=A0A6C0BT97_9ZZZZ
MGFMTEDGDKKLFGPQECWCTQHGQVWYPCKKTKMCKETNEKYKVLKEKYYNSNKFKQDQKREIKRRQNVKESRKRRAQERKVRRRRNTNKSKPKQQTKKRFFSFFN